MARREEVEARIGTLARTADVEIIPLKGVQAQLAMIPKETTVAVTMSPTFGIDRTIDYVERVAQLGHRALPHLAARQVRDRASLGGLVERLQGLGVKDLMVVGGDAEEPAGTYASAGELLEDLSTMDHGFAISVACYPEHHPKISEEALLEALQGKQRFAASMVSQLCFDAKALVTWLTSARQAGITLPLRLGLAPPMNPARLLELSLRIGVGASIAFLSTQHGVVGTLLRGRLYKPEHLLGELGQALVAPEMGIDGLHLFSFNQVQATVEWQRRVTTALSATGGGRGSTTR